MNGDLDLAPLEEAVEEALASGGERGLDVLGYGEISFVLGWPGPEGRLACKRLPLFETPEALDAYERCLTLYVERLAERGTTVVASRLVTVSKAGGRIAAYCVQPALPPQAMAPWRLARAEPDEGRGVLGRIVDRIGSTVGDGLGLDGQLSNWAVAGDDVVYFDVTTPMMRDGEGNELLDTDLFLAALPWLLRGVVRRFLLRGILDTFYDPRGVVVDLAGNLHKEGLAGWVPPLVEEADRRLGLGITEEEVRRYYVRDARVWAALQRARRLDRRWQRSVRRRPYPFLVPERIERHPPPRTPGASRG